MKQKKKSRSILLWIIMPLVLLGVFVLCICLGSVNIPFEEVRHMLAGLWNRQAGLSEKSRTILLTVRLPRVLCVGLVGASLSICGAAMQGLLKNPLADGTTLGVSSGASLGAVISLAFGFSIPGIPGAATALMAIAFSFLALVLILGLAYSLDSSLSTNTIILIGVIFNMFAGSFTSLVISFAGDRVKTITFWTMGSLSGSGYRDVLLLLIACVVCGAMLLRYAQELNAFSLGEDNARHIGVDVKKVKLFLLIAASVLIGVCVSVGGTIGFVGLVVPHISRMLIGPNHKKLLPFSLFFGAAFLMLADLAGRVLIRPKEIPIGVVTSLVGSLVFIYIFYTTRKGGSHA